VIALMRLGGVAPSSRQRFSGAADDRVVTGSAVLAIINPF